MGSELVWPVYLGVISLTVALLSVGVMWVRGVHLVWSSIGLAASALARGRPSSCCGIAGGFFVRRY